MQLCAPSSGLAALPRCPKPYAILSRSRFRSKNPGFGHLRTRFVVAVAEEEGSTVGVKDDEKSKGIGVPSFLFETSGERNSEGDDDGESGESFLSKIDVKVGFEETATYLIYGASALAILWISSAVVSAVDSIPLFPKLMEVVGLGYTVWFTYRYLIFKENRKELLEKLAELKTQVIGSDDD